MTISFSDTPIRLGGKPDFGFFVWGQTGICVRPCFLFHSPAFRGGKTGSDTQAGYGFILRRLHYAEMFWNFAHKYFKNDSTRLCQLDDSFIVESDSTRICQLDDSFIMLDYANRMIACLIASS